MKAHINFDTLEYMEELKNSGLTQQQAEGITKATAKAFDQMIEVKELATKSDILELKAFMVKSLIAAVSIIVGLQSAIFSIIHFIK